MSSAIQFTERHQDYILGPNQAPNFASLGAGQSLTGVAFNMDPDAPFLLRGLMVRCQYDANRTQTALQGLRLRFSGPNQDYRSQGLVPVNENMAFFGQAGSPKPIYPQIWYPPKGTLYVDVQNTGGSAITNLTLGFRGVKLYKAGSVSSATYPHSIADRKDYPYPYADLDGSNQPVPMVLPVSTPSNGILKRFVPKPDTDHVIRGIIAGNAFPPYPSEVSIQLMDENQKPYSNDLVPMDFFCVAPGSPASFPYGPTPNYLSAYGTGGAHPGLLYPELYIPAKHMLYFYISRQDAYLANQVPVTYQLSFEPGEKVYA